MNANAKSTKTEETIENVFCPVAYATLATKAVERAVEAGKITLNLAAQQNADILAAIKKALKNTPLANLPGLDLAGQAVEGYIAIQKNLLDLAQEQFEAALEASQQTDISKAKSEINSILQASLDRSIAAQNQVVDFAVKQTKAGIDAVKAQPGVAGSPVEQVTESVQRGFDTVIAAQKEILNLATKQVKAASAKA